jgi:glycosyltransferase involved in cell wall biosynthesis
MSGTPDSADVTVIIPAFRAEKTIDRALRSVVGQTCQPGACVVVDDGSPDATLAVANSWKDRMGGIALTVIRQNNAGAGAARNRALQEAQTPYVAFLDADDEWLPEKIARCMERLAGPDTVLVAHDSYAIEDGRETRLDCARRFHAAAASPFVGLYRRGYIDTATVVAKREAVLAAGAFDTNLPNAQDFDLWLAMLKDPATKYEVFNDALSRYHITPGSIMSHVERRRRCCIDIALRYAPELRRHPGSPLASLWFRVLAIHKEAMDAHLVRHEPFRALRAALLAPVSLVGTTLRYLTDDRGRRRAGMKNLTA